MSDIGKHALRLAKNIQIESLKHSLPPEESAKSRSQQVLAFSIVSGTRGYIEKVVNQINSTYEVGAYDACAVMIRRLIETLIIEAFESHGIDSKIKNANGDFYHLRDLITHTLNETWNLGRNAKRALPKLKDIGDKSAHSRRYLAHRQDIDKLVDDIRTVSQELVHLAGLK